MVSNFSCLFWVLLTTLVFSCPKGFSQPAQRLVLGFYNVENLFDTLHDAGKQDYEYLPQGYRAWTAQRYQQKLLNLSRVIRAMNDWQGPDLLALCEVENQRVLQDLLNTPLLKNQGFSILHHESPDHRGIDLAIIYRADKFNLVKQSNITIKIDSTGYSKTRDILYAVMKVKDSDDTLHVFVNHWPSRRGGVSASAPKRKIASETLRLHLDSLRSVNPACKVVVCGDFNDGPQDESMLNLASGEDSLINLALPLHAEGVGTLKHEGRWNLFDQFLVSPNLMGKDKIQVSGSHQLIFSPSWLQEEDVQGIGNRPLRTFSGPNYLGGYSDHFPVLLFIHFEK